MRVGQCRLLVFATLVAAFGGERVNHEGRLLGDLPSVATPILFNTREADTVLSAMQIMPADSAWNEDISRRPTLGNSDAMIARIIADLRSDRRTLRAFHEMNFVLVPDTQATVPIRFFNYGDESDPSPYPIPTNLPVETWPRETDGLTLSEWQQDVNDDGGDRHAITVMPRAGFIWETWLTRLVNGSWEASNGAKFDLKSNTLRPYGWTSGDAAGLPMFPALVRFDECERGMVEHAMRIVVKRTRLGPIYPATHQASVGGLTDPNIPAMGQRVRLKSGFVIPPAWTKHEKAVLLGLKKYGAIVADNGNFFSISVTPDNRYPANAFSHLSSISITNFEVVRSTGPTEGPRSPGAPRVSAGPAAVAAVNAPFQLQGAISGANSALSLRTEWKFHSGPAIPLFEDATRTNSTMTFPTAGEYILILGAFDEVHAPAYDAVRISAGSGRGLRISKTAQGILLEMIGSGPFAINQCADLRTGYWEAAPEVTGNTWLVPESSRMMFYRLSP